MSRKIVKILCWTLGVATAGAILGAKHSYAPHWYAALLEQHTSIAVGAVIGLLIGFGATFGAKSK